MIKCEVTVCGAISRSASVKQNKDGQQFISFGVTIPIKSRKKDDGSADFELGVTMDGDQRQAAQFTTGRRVLILGVLTLKKKNGKTYFNLKAEGGVELTKSTEPDSIVGTMQFKGKLGRKVWSIRSLTTPRSRIVRSPHGRQTGTARTLISSGCVSWTSIQATMTSPPPTATSASQVTCRWKPTKRKSASRAG